MDIVFPTPSDEDEWGEILDFIILGPEDELTIQLLPEEEEDENTARRY